MKKRHVALIGFVLASLFGCQSTQSGLPKNAILAHDWSLAYFEKSLGDPVHYPQDKDGPFMVLYSASEFAALKPIAAAGDNVQEYVLPNDKNGRRYLCLLRSGRIVGIVNIATVEERARTSSPEPTSNSASNRF
jgi:hypothetical protein